MNFVVPVNIFTSFARAPFSWTVQHTTMCLDLKMFKERCRIEAANKKLMEMFNKDTEGAEQFQAVLDEEADFIDGILTRISELNIVIQEVERKRNEL